MFDISQQEIDFNCPGCGSKNTITLKQAQDQETVICTGCQKKINLVDKDGSIDKSVNDIERATQELDDTIKNFGK